MFFQPVAGEGEEEIPEFGVMHLCSDRIDAFGVYLLDSPDLIIIYVCRSVSAKFCQEVLGVSSYGLLNELVSTIGILFFAFVHI